MILRVYVNTCIPVYSCSIFASSCFILNKFQYILQYQPLQRNTDCNINQHNENIPSMRCIPISIFTKSPADLRDTPERTDCFSSSSGMKSQTTIIEQMTKRVGFLGWVPLTCFCLPRTSRHYIGYEYLRINRQS